MVPLSILDLSPVTTGISGAQALRNSLDLARMADQIGFARYWVAEHHNLPNIASSAPDIMIGQIAAITSHMRIGSGGVMLPNHAPLQVAERYKVLEGLFPGRIDLGIGRAPGTDPVTSYALRRRQDDPASDDFLDRFQELLAFEQHLFPESHPFRKVSAMPADVPLPPIFLLGSSDYSAQLAGQIGAAFAFAHHFANFDAAEAMKLYRDNFRPSPAHAKPFAILGTHVICADTDEEAEHLAKSVDLNIVRRAKGEYLPRRLARRRRGLRLHTARPCAHGAEPHAAVGRRARDGEGHADAADRSHAGRRIDGDQHDFRPRSAQAFV